MDVYYMHMYRIFCCVSGFLVCVYPVWGDPIRAGQMRVHCIKCLCNIRPILLLFVEAKPKGIFQHDYIMPAYLTYPIATLYHF